MKTFVLVDARDIVKDMTMDIEIRVINYWQVKLRLFVALQLVKFAAWIGGQGLQINQEVGVLVTDNKIEKL